VTRFPLPDRWHLAVHNSALTWLSFTRKVPDAICSFSSLPPFLSLPLLTLPLDYRLLFASKFQPLCDELVRSLIRCLAYVLLSPLSPLSFSALHLSHRSFFLPSLCCSFTLFISSFPSPSLILSPGFQRSRSLSLFRPVFNRPRRPHPQPDGQPGPSRGRLLTASSQPLLGRLLTLPLPSTPPSSTASFLTLFVVAVALLPVPHFSAIHLVISLHTQHLLISTLELLLTSSSPLHFLLLALSSILFLHFTLFVFSPSLPKICGHQRCRGGSSLRPSGLDSGWPSAGMR